MVAEKAVMPSAASRSERIIFSFVRLLAGRFLPKNRIRFSSGEQLSFGQYLPNKIRFPLSRAQQRRPLGLARFSKRDLILQTAETLRPGQHRLCRDAAGSSGYRCSLLGLR